PAPGAGNDRPPNPNPEPLRSMGGASIEKGAPAMENPPIPPRRSDTPERHDRAPGPDGKSTAFAVAGMVGIALLAVLAVAIMRGKPAANTDQFALAEQPSQSRIEKCNQYAAQVAHESGAIGGATSVRDDDPNLAGLSDENRFSDAARVAYRDCMLGIH